jgi:hypothetical protein
MSFGEGVLCETLLGITTRKSEATQPMVRPVRFIFLGRGQEECHDHLLATGWMIYPTLHSGLGDTVILLLSSPPSRIRLYCRTKSSPTRTCSCGRTSKCGDPASCVKNRFYNVRLIQGKLPGSEFSFVKKKKNIAALHAR